MTSKRIISILLCIATIFGTFALSFAEENEMPAGYTEEIGMLTDLGVIDAELEIESELTRGEFAEMIFKIISGSDTYKPSEQVFADIDAENKYFRSTGYLQSRGFISGYGDGCFKPDAKMSANEATAILVRILGYQPLADMKGDWPEGIQQAAEIIGLYEGLNIEGDNSIKYAEVYKLIHNALFISMMKYDVVDGKPKYEVLPEDGKTILSTYLDMEYISGIVTDNSKTALGGESGIGENSIKIGDVVMKTNTYSSEGLLGCYVKAFYRVEDDINTLVHAVKMTQKYTELVIAEDKIIEPSVTELVYEQEDSDRYKTAKIRKDAYYIYNGEAVLSITADDIKGAEVRLIDYNLDGYFDILFVRKVQHMVYAGTNMNQDILRGKFGETIDLTRFDDVIIIKEGAEITIDDIAPYSALAIAEGTDSLTIEIYTEVIVGKLDSLTDDEYNIDGRSYKIASEYKNSSVAKPKLGEEGTFYIGKDGKLIYYESASAKSIGVAITLRDHGKYEDKARPVIEIYTTANTFESFEFQERVKVNGKRIDREELFDIAELFTGQTFNRQVIQYILGDTGDIAEIDFPDGTRPDKDIIQTASAKRTYKWCNPGTDAINPTSDIENEDNRAIFISAKTWFFKLPSDKNAREFYSVSQGSLPYNHNATIDNCQVLYSSYSDKRLSIASVVTADVTTSRLGSWPARSSLVVSVVAGMDEKDNLCDILMVYQNGALQTYYSMDNAKINGLKPGDMIQLLTEGKKVVRYRKSYSIDKNKTCVEYYNEMKAAGTLDKLKEFYSVKDLSTIDSLDYYISKETIESTATWSERSEGTFNTNKGGQYVTGEVTYRDGSYITVKTSDNRSLNFYLNPSEVPYYRTYTYYVKATGKKPQPINASDVSVGDKVCLFTEAYSVIDIMVIE